jgi:hypothetical protein
MAALLGETFEYCQTSLPAPPSFVYSAFHASPAAFIDVVSGNNQLGSALPLYSAATGYDDVSGVGVPLGTSFAEALCPSRTPSFALRAPVAAASATLIGYSGARTIDVTPRVPGVIDLGPRSGNEATNVQLVLLPSTRNEQTVVAALRARGFTVTQTFENHLVVDAQAPAAVVSSVFATSIHNISQGRFGIRHMPTRPVTIPADLAPYISGVLLDNVVTMRAR